MKCVLILVLAVLAVAMSAPQENVKLIDNPDSFFGQPSANVPGGLQPTPYQPGSGPNRPNQGVPQSWLRH